MLFLVVPLIVWSFLLSIAALRRLPFSWYAPELASYAALFALLVASWLVLIPAFWLSYEVSVGIATSLVALLFGLSWHRTHRGSQPAVYWVGASRNRALAWGWAVFTVAISALLSFYVYHSELPPHPNWDSGISAWQDIGLHMSLISYWESQPHFMAVLPISYHSPLPYHFLMDFFSMLLHKSGLPIGLALCLPMLSLVLALPQACFFLAWRLWRSAAASVLSVYLALFGGSCWGLHYLWLNLQHHSGTIGSFLASSDWDYTNLWDKNLYFSNLVTSSVLPQRPIIFGYCAVTFVFLILVECGRRSLQQMRPALLMTGVLTGLMPLAYLHGWLMCLGLLIWNAGLESVRTRRLRTEWTASVMVALAISVPQIVWLKSMQPGSSAYMQSRLGWMTDLRHHQCVLTFYAENMGPAFYFMWLNARKLYERRRGLLYRLYAPVLVAFIIVNLVLLQPAPYDNIKVILFVYVLICVMASGFLVRQWHRGPWVTRLVTVLVVLAWTGSGLMTHLREINGAESEVLNARDVEFGEIFRTMSAPDTVVACMPDVHSPVSMVSGREIIMGYAGFVSSYGLQWQEREQDLRDLLAGGEKTPALLQKYHVSFVVGDRSSGCGWNFNYDYFGARYPTVYDDSRWVVYRIDRVKL